MNDDAFIWKSYTYISIITNKKKINFWLNDSYLGQKSYEFYFLYKKPETEYLTIQFIHHTELQKKKENKLAARLIITYFFWCCMTNFFCIKIMKFMLLCGGFELIQKRVLSLILCKCVIRIYTYLSTFFLVQHFLCRYYIHKINSVGICLKEKYIYSFECPKYV